MVGRTETLWKCLLVHLLDLFGGDEVAGADAFMGEGEGRLLFSAGIGLVGKFLISLLQILKGNDGLCVTHGWF